MSPDTRPVRDADGGWRLPIPYNPRRLYWTLLEVSDPVRVLDRTSESEIEPVYELATRRGVYLIRRTSHPGWPWVHETPPTSHKIALKWWREILAGRAR
ncbi:hypothetical protein ACGFNU_24330 [Spirillospora sp. NPDC048911]|uniref:hypothetical protein n=1 Tax=Spirillospora sp. NPDC048911 TaxID=3364527 RepID=UPI0037112C98